MFFNSNSPILRESERNNGEGVLANKLLGEKLLLKIIVVRSFENERNIFRNGHKSAFFGTLTNL